MLCSCKAPHHPPAHGTNAQHAAARGDAADAGAAAWAEAGAGIAAAEPMPMAETIVGPWAPPGIVAPWPYDEYLRDGGDRDLPVHVLPDWHVDGMETEDTIAHYDTLEGLTVVEPSNRVLLVCPALRRSAQRDRTSGRGAGASHAQRRPADATGTLRSIANGRRQHEQGSTARRDRLQASHDLSHADGRRRGFAGDPARQLPGLLPAVRGLHA